MTDHIDEDEPERSDADFLRDLSSRLRNIPVMYGVDGYDSDRLRWIAQDLKSKSSSEQETGT